MKFNLNQRRQSERAEKTQTTSEFLQQDRFAGVQHHTGADSVPMDPRTPKRVLDELEGVDVSSPLGFTDIRTKRSGGPESPSHPSIKRPFKTPPRPNSETSVNAVLGPMISTPQKLDLDPNETIFDVKEPDFPPTSEVLLDRGSEIHAEHAKQQRLKGFRKRGHVAYTQYTYDPGQGIHYSHYVEHLYAGSPVEHYTQVLIWCLNSRVKLSQNQTDINAKDQATIKALNTLIYELARGNKLSMNWTRQTYRSLPDSERALNPTNERNSKQINVLRQFLKDLQRENKEWMDLLEESEQKESPAKRETHTTVVELPKVGIDEGLKSICSKVSQLEVDIEDVQESIAKYISQFSQPTSLLSALDI